jgi:predicted enzyme related to lactoylglutathione lyase
VPTIQPVILTGQPQRVIRFYTVLFAATETYRFPDGDAPFYVRLAVGGSELGVVSDGKDAPDSEPRLLLSVAVDDVEAVLARVEQAGGAVLGPPNDMPWGQRVAHVKDPDGNLVNLTQDL